MSFKYLIKSEKLNGDDFPIDPLLVESYDGLLYISQKDYAGNDGISPNSPFDATVELETKQARQLKFLLERFLDDK